MPVKSDHPHHPSPPPARHGGAHHPGPAQRGDGRGVGAERQDPRRPAVEGHGLRGSPDGDGSAGGGGADAPRSIRSIGREG